MAIHTLSIGGTSYVIEPKYASSAGYAATSGNAKYASSATYATTAAHAVTAGNTKYAATAGHAVTAGNAKYASSATYASSANTASYAVTASNAKYASSATYATTAAHAVTAGNAKYATTASYASSAGYAATAGRASYASSASYADRANQANYASSATYAAQTTAIQLTGIDIAQNYPLVLSNSVAGVSGSYHILATDTANALSYNPSSNTLTTSTIRARLLGVSGGVTIYNGANFSLVASSSSASDPGDIVFQNSDAAEIGRLWLDQGSVFKLRYGSSDAAKTIIHEGNISDYLTTQSMKTLKIATGQNAGTDVLTYASYDGSSDVTIDMVAVARKATTASYAVTAYRALYAGSASNATHASSAGYALNAHTSNFAVTASMSRETWTSPSTSIFYIAGSTTSTSGSNTLVKNTAVKVESNSVRASGGFYETSDARLKTITNDVEIDFERLKSIPKIQYIKKGETAPHIGTIAQDLQKVYPEFVETGDDGYLVVDYAKLSVIPLKAVDLLYDEVNTLKDELKTVKEENQTLKERLDNIEKLINN